MLHTTGLKFQFTPLREGRQNLLAIAKALNAISIHAPARGATPFLDEFSNGEHIISIHAPARGATKKLHENWKVFKYFNSRPCERGDDVAASKCKTFIISIHAPARGATLSIKETLSA